MKALLLSLALVSATSAQDLAVIPLAQTNTEGESSATIPALGTDGHRQWLIGAGHLQDLIGHNLTALVFRRDSSWPIAFTGGTGTVVLRMGPATHPPLAASDDLVENLPNATEVFRGTVAIPASGAPTGMPTWTAPDVVELTFASPYAYTGGDLAIEALGSNLSSPGFWWVADGVEDPVEGTVLDIGVACGPSSGVNRITAGIGTDSIVLGGSAEFFLHGQPNASAFLLLGASTFPNPIDLGALGAPGCELRVDFFAVLAKTVVDSGIQGVGGLARALVPLPAQTTLLGGQLYAQWLELGAVIASSQTMRFQIAPRLPVLDMTTLIRHADGSVEIRPRKAPVFGFRYL
jgi:hypothetical protein